MVNFCRQQVAEKELNEVMVVLHEKQKQLATVEAHIANLQAMFDASVKEKKELEDGIELTGLRLVRAGRLTQALGDEQIRWEQGVKVRIFFKLSTILSKIPHFSSLQRLFCCFLTFIIVITVDTTFLTPLGF